MTYHDDKYHRQAQVDAWEHLLGYEVLDEKGGKIGTVKALWEDYTRQPAYLGVATSWLDLGRIHLVPAQFATLSERQRCVRLSFPADVVKGAPECHANDEITLSGETKIRDYYSRKGIGSGMGRGYDAPRRREAAEDRSIRTADWAARERREETEDVPDRAEREMGLPFEEERTTPLRKIYRETPVAEPVRPREENARSRDDDAQPRIEDDFIPLRKDASMADRRLREEDRDDLPLR